jgi:hypothetical protein
MAIQGFEYHIVFLCVWAFVLLWTLTLQSIAFSLTCALQTHMQVRVEGVEEGGTENDAKVQICCSFACS